MGIKIQPKYASINLVTDLCEPWIELWAGDEWGESMEALHRACHTSYGFSDEDCARLASILFENLEFMKGWMDDEGHDYGLTSDEDEAEVQAKCREIRDYWRKGGNLSHWYPAVTAAQETLKTIPAWIFGETKTATVEAEPKCRCGHHDNHPHGGWDPKCREPLHRQIYDRPMGNTD